MIYIFDIDGTLTPSRNPIDKKFKEDFINFCKHQKVCLVTGSDRDKSIEQIGEDAWLSVDRAYQCCGNQVWSQGKLLKQTDWTTDQYLKDFLEFLLEKSEYKHRYGNHIEDRGSMVNFSIVGRNCTQEQRDEYFKYDNEKGERKIIANAIKEKFPNLDAVLGGQISIDIYPKGMDKSQVFKHIEEKENSDEYYFIGDRTKEGGNDYPLAKLMKETNNCYTFQTTGWEQTQQILESLDD